MHPDQWMVIEILESRTVNGRCIIDRFLVLELCTDADAAIQRYRTLRRAQRTGTHHDRQQERELSWIHTSWKKLEFQVTPCIWHFVDHAPHDPA